MQKAALPDLFKPALEERVRQGEITMSKTRVTALAGPLMVLVGAIWLLEMAGSLLLRILQVGEERFWDLFLTAWATAFVLSFIPLLFALVGNSTAFPFIRRHTGQTGPRAERARWSGCNCQHDEVPCAGYGSTRAAGRGGPLGRLRGCGLVLEPDPRAGGRDDCAQPRVRMVWSPCTPAFAGAVLHAVYLRQRPLPGAAGDNDGGSGGRAVNSGGVISGGI